MELIQKQVENVKYQQALTRVNTRVDELNEGWVPEFEEDVFVIFYDADDDEYKESSHPAYCNYATPFEVMFDCGVVDKIIKEHKEDLDIIFNYHK